MDLLRISRPLLFIFLGVVSAGGMAQQTGVRGAFGMGMQRSLLSILSEEAWGKTPDNRFFALDYILPGYAGSLPLRHLLGVGYTYNPDPAYRMGTAAWIPQAMFSFEPVYIAVGAGPSLKTNTTPANGGYFKLQFEVSVGLDLFPFSLELFLRHASNAYTSRPNYGSDYWGLAAAFAF